MAEVKLPEFSMPGSSWETIKRIVQAYYAVQGEMESTVEQISRLANISRPVVSKNNNFLRSIGIVQQEKYQLTPLGVRLAAGWAKKDDPTLRVALQEIVSSVEPLKRIVKTVQARAGMSEEGFRTELMIALGLNEKSPGIGNLRTLIELLYESRTIVTDQGQVVFRGYYVGEMKGVEEEKANNPPENPPPSHNGTRGSTKTFQLQNGATLSLSVSADLLAINAEDRKFVLSIVDKIEEYVNARGGKEN